MGWVAISATLSGVAVVCCVHDREKRQVTSEHHVAALGARYGVRYDRKQHRIFLCGCCENLFVDPGDEPAHCHACRGPLAHQLVGPLAKPLGPLL